MIKVLVVDDSQVLRELLKYMLSVEPDIEVIGVAQDGEEAVEKAIKLKPDIITMDLNMPKMNGIEATRKIMHLSPVPIIVISGSTHEMEISAAFQAIEAGAVTVTDKMGFSSGNAKELVKMIKLMSEVKVVHRFQHDKKQLENIKRKRNINLIGIGGSTGAPTVFQTILKALPNTYPPVLMVQHIAPGFLEGFCAWLRSTTSVNIKIAENGERIKPNQVYIAPSTLHMGVDGLFQIELSQNKNNESYCPSVSYLFQSIAKHHKADAMGVLLTGMGHDGADGLKQMRDAGALTVAQDEKSAIIYGMPGQAVALGAAEQVLSTEKIAELVRNIALGQS